MPDPIAELFRRENGRVLATLIRLLGDFELAEDAMQDAFAAALIQWPSEGTPANPRACSVTSPATTTMSPVVRVLGPGR
jgi:RNA polymerase sigma-70 factor (ECF subfamily)